MSDSATADRAQALLASLLQAAVSAGCSDIHLRGDAVPYGRVDGRLLKMQGQPLTAQDLEAMITLTTRRPLPSFDVASFEFSFEQRGVARFRGHAFREAGSWGLVLRAVPLSIPSFQELRLPPVIKQLARPEPGLVIVTGPTGSGKSTTAAAMLAWLAETECLHIVTVEDPVEYRIGCHNSCVTQREVGLDTPSFSDALKAAMREDPDVLFLGEIRDRESLEVVLNAAESGHSVITTFHTHTSVHTLQRLVGMTASEDQASTRARLTDSLRAIISQRLLPRFQARGRVLGTEVMLNNYAVKECLRDPARLKTLPQVLERSNDQNMHTFEQSLLQLVQARLVDANTACAQSSSPGNFRRALSLSGIAA